MTIHVTAAQLAEIPAHNGRPSGLEITDVDGNVWFWAVCLRCGGTGSYSFNLLDGDKCYGCFRTCGTWVPAKVWKRRQADKARREAKRIAAAVDRAEKAAVELAARVLRDWDAALAEIPAQEARLTAKAARAPYPAGRVAVEATVLSVQVRENPYVYNGTTLKLLAELDGGYRVWLTCPAALSDVEEGERVSFTATFEVSSDDPEFGFASRPAKARVLVAA